MTGKVVSGMGIVFLDGRDVTHGDFFDGVDFVELRT